MPQTKILTIHEFGKQIRLTPNAIRIHMHRNSGAVPQGFKIGKKWFWKQADVNAWINEQAKQAKTH